MLFINAARSGTGANALSSLELLAVEAVSG